MADFLGHLLRKAAESGCKEVMNLLRQSVTVTRFIRSNVLELIHKHLFINQITNIVF